jgi:uncharacterized membrane protein
MGEAAMTARLTAFWAYLKESLWAVPLAMVVLAAALAIAAVEVRLVPADSAWWIYGGSSENAAEFLSSLLSSMINMATLAISITMVVLTLAAQQLGPRLIFSFMGDRRTQTALGVFIGTAVYLLLVLRIVQGRGLTEVPNLAVTLGTALVLLSFISLVLFVHHLARSIVADTMIERVGEVLDQAISLYLPEKRAQDPLAGTPMARPDGIPLRTETGGYVQVINYDKLLAAAEKADALIELALRPGHHVLANGIYAWVTPASALGDRLRSEIENSVLIGPERTVVQDVEYSVRQLVEIALRALSPSVNDPYTALAVIDRMALSLGRVLERGPPQMVWRDEEGNPRVAAPSSDFEGILDAAFTQIRQSAGNHAAVHIRLAEKLGQLAAQADAVQCQALENQLELVSAAGRRDIPEQADRDVLEKRVELARETCRSRISGEPPATGRTDKSRAPPQRQWPAPP